MSIVDAERVDYKDAVSVAEKDGKSGSLTLPDYVRDDDFESRLTENALRTLEKKYLIRNEEGDIVETPREAVYRMARTMAIVEGDYSKEEGEIERLARDFYEMISRQEFCPAGRIWTNAGTEIGGLFNCYVLPVGDSLEEIYDAVKWAAIVHKNGGGTGYNFSAIRPRGLYVKTSKGVASGPVSFIRQFDRETEIINSGNRRGANMGILNVDHPDVLDFIRAKTVRGEITNFNVSVGVTDAYMEQVGGGGFYDLSFNGKPFTAKQLLGIRKNIEENKAGGSEVGVKPRPPSAIIAENGVDVIDAYSGEVCGRIKDGKVQYNACYIFDIITELAHKTADPGVIFLDRINKDNPLPRDGPLQATNPCGEQPLHPFDACNLGSINLAVMVTEEEGRMVVDYDRINRVMKPIIRFMDNVNDANRGPLPQIERTVRDHRRIGLGVMGWADMLVKLGIPYDSDEACELGEKVMMFISEGAKKESKLLADEKGVFPAFERSVYDNRALEDRVRNLQRTTIAPTGTIHMVFDVSSGIEPLFALAYTKNIRGGDKFEYRNGALKEKAEKAGIATKEFFELVELCGSLHWGERLSQIEERITYLKLKEDRTPNEEIILSQLQKATEDIRRLLKVFPESRVPESLRAVFKTSFDISPNYHVKVQAAFQRGTDNAVSKTINMPPTATVESVREAYMDAYRMGLKGITVYVDGCKDVQVLDVGINSSDISRRDLRVNKPETLTEKCQGGYSINTGEGKLHISISEDQRGFPYEVFCGMLPIGSSRGSSAAVIGLQLSRMLEGNPNPDLLQMIKDLGMVKGDKSIGMGPNRVDSVEHAISIALLYHFQKKGLLVRDEGTGVLNQVVFKNGKEGNTDKQNGSGFSFTPESLFCGECGSRNVRMTDGCKEPSCLDCGFSKCE